MVGGWSNIDCPKIAQAIGMHREDDGRCMVYGVVQWWMVQGGIGLVGDTPLAGD